MHTAKKLSHFISLALHPLLMPTYGLWLIFQFIEAYYILLLPKITQYIIIGVVFMNTALLPSIFILTLYRTGRISNLQISNKEERWLPLLITAILYTTSYYVLKNLGLNPLLLLLLSGAIMAIIISFFINLWYKLSLHMVGIGGILGTLYALGKSNFSDISWLIISLILLSGIVGSARYHLKQHTLPQLILGFLVGTLISGGLALFVLS
jgi:hypothetical protein